VVRGGSWRQPSLFLRTTARDGAAPETRSPEIGFRCAK
jgi:formylglycine-generating enzyme required for sulfatase activity